MAETDSCRLTLDLTNIGQLVGDESPQVRVTDHDAGHDADVWTPEALHSISRHCHHTE